MSTPSSRPDVVAERLKKEQRARLKEEQRIADFKWFMDDPRGRRLMHGWLKEFGLYEKSYTGGAEKETFFREGRRSTSLDLLREMNTFSPEQFITMLEEQLDERSGHRD